MNLSFRNNQLEMLDAADIPIKELYLNLKELNFINTYLGGHAITIKGFKKLLPNKKNLKTFAEIGCGGGDNIFAVLKWFEKNANPNVKSIGIDIKNDCIQYATNKNSLNTSWILSDYKEIQWTDQQPEIIFSSLFCHHFSDKELIEQINWMYKNAEIGFFINDLQRNIIAYYAIKWLTILFSKSYLVKNDAPLSVSKSLTKKEWKKILKQSGINNYTIQWKWAFRYLIVVKKEEDLCIK
jgi:ubiquinone/menaquinone biosynthesis C-methylase UbiE